MSLFENTLIVTSTDAGIIQVFQINFSKINRLIEGQAIPKIRENYNPYRIVHENHNEIVGTLNTPVLIQQWVKSYQLENTVMYDKLRE